MLAIIRSIYYDSIFTNFIFVICYISTLILGLICKKTLNKILYSKKIWERQHIETPANNKIVNNVIRSLQKENYQKL